MKNLADFEQSYYLPEWLDCLLDKPFSQSASIQIDCCFWYCQQKSEGVRP